MVCDKRQHNANCNNTDDDCDDDDDGGGGNIIIEIIIIIVIIIIWHCFIFALLCVSNEVSSKYML